MGILLDGRQLATEIEKKLAQRVQKLFDVTQCIPLLATIQVGNDPASTTYVQMKVKACERIGMQSKQVHFCDPNLVTTQEIIRTIQQLNRDDAVHGILLQHPVPFAIDERACFDAIALEKDVDGVTTAGFGRLAMGEQAYASATPAGIMRMLDHYELPIAGQHAVIVGRSPILGKPMAVMLLNRNATITICHSKTKQLPQLVGQADILIGAVGKPQLIKGAWIKDGAVVIDAGYHPALRTGDIELESIKDRCLAYTPVPGGVGPMTIVMLMQQTVEAAEKKFNHP